MLIKRTQTDAGLEVHQRLAPYVGSSPYTYRMKPLVRAVNLLYMFRDYSPLMTCLAVLILPFALIPTAGSSVFYHPERSNYGSLIYMAQVLSLAAFLMGTARKYFTYQHMDLSKVSNIHAQEIWSAPCKSRILLALSLTFLWWLQKYHASYQ